MVVTSRGSEPGGPRENPAGTAYPIGAVYGAGTEHRAGTGHSAGTVYPAGAEDRAGTDHPAGAVYEAGTRHPVGVEEPDGSGPVGPGRWRRFLAMADGAAVPGIMTAVLGRAMVAVNREARRRPALSAALVVAGLGAVVVSASGPGAAAPEFRSPPAAVMSTPPVQVSAAAVHTGLAPYAPPAPVEGPQSPSARSVSPSGRSGSPAPVPSVTDDDAAVLSGVLDLPAEKTPTGAATRTVTGSGSTGTPVTTASVAVGEPREGESVTATTTVSGTADLPGDHQVWLLSRHGSGTYRVEGACRGGSSFTCGPATLESGGDETFQFTAVVVDPATARSLQAGETRDGLPANLARSEVTVRRAAA